MVSESRSAPSAGIPWRLIGVVCLLFVLIPPSLAYGWTQYRYGQGSFGFEPAVMHQTPGFNDRVYNAVYREHGCNSGWWEVHYRKSPGNFSDITWRVESACSPTEQGLTTGPREAWCKQNTHPLYSPGAYNCDTTVP